MVLILFLMCLHVHGATARDTSFNCGAAAPAASFNLRVPEYCFESRESNFQRTVQSQREADSSAELDLHAKLAEARKSLDDLHEKLPETRKSLDDLQKEDQKSLDSLDKLLLTVEAHDTQLDKLNTQLDKIIKKSRDLLLT
ncbi:MAG: hypothetical protein OXC30_00790 [Alphaproteobacteria bacterium]|nr:hypothetical protein [Alphaproteobacteria bacterium]